MKKCRESKSLSARLIPVFKHCEHLYRGIYSEEREKHGAAWNNRIMNKASLLKNPLIIISGYLLRFFLKLCKMLSKKHYKISNCFVTVLERPLVYANLIPPSHYCSKNLSCFCIVYWKLNILWCLCPLPFPRPKILVVLFRNDDQSWEVKGEKRTSENLRLKASKNWDVNGNFLILNFFSRAIEISRQLRLCLFE